MNEIFPTPLVERLARGRNVAVAVVGNWAAIEENARAASAAARAGAGRTGPHSI